MKHSMEMKELLTELYHDDNNWGFEIHIYKNWVVIQYNDQLGQNDKRFLYDIDNVMYYAEKWDCILGEVDEDYHNSMQGRVY